MNTPNKKATLTKVVWDCGSCGKTHDEVESAMECCHSKFPISFQTLVPALTFLVGVIVGTCIKM